MSKVRLGFLAGASRRSSSSSTSPVRRQPATPQPGPGTPRYAPIPSNWKETEVERLSGDGRITLDPTNADQKTALRGRIVWNSGWRQRLDVDYLAQHGFGTADLLKPSTRAAARDGWRRSASSISRASCRRRSRPVRSLHHVPNPDDPAAGSTRGRLRHLRPVIGRHRLRISDNPKFDAAAKAEWMKHVGPDGLNHALLRVANYYNDQKLVRPYIVGMAARFATSASTRSPAG